ncbi:uncharacterized protein LOC105286403 [Ooceraea biroi]|uniref:uncharacterized protein LOC105286403 n=1 Tax=Ooceraea biroi TaxID=2015173 RepID=UPI000F08E16E|nr:uncharacterized protein LOC105286403 [Ooceraea biroi]
MAKSVDVILLQIFVLSFALADPAEFRREHERRWNTPPKLTPESVVKMSSREDPQTRFLSLIPVTATLSLNTGHNNAHSVSLGASLDGISLSESNSYNHPGGYGVDGSPVSVSKSTSLSAGFSGISTAGAKAYSDGNNAKTESHSHSFGQATASAFGVVESGQAITGAASSVGSSQSSAASGINRERFFSQYPNRPIWSNVGPNNGHNDRRFDRPTLIISQPHSGTRPSLNIDAHDTSGREQRPRIHIYKWQPNHRVFPRPSLSIEHQPYHSWSDQTRGSTGLQVAASANSFSSSSYGSSASDSASQINKNPLNFALSSTSSSTSEHRAGNVNVHAAGNGYVQESASSEGRAFIRFPKDEQNPIILNIKNRDSEEQSDVVSDLADAIGELFDIV